MQVIKKDFISFLIIPLKLNNHFMNILRIIFLLFICFSCSTSLRNKSLTITNKMYSDSNRSWYQKDLKLDGIPGISLEKWHLENSKKPKGSIVVAVIDTQIDLNHEDLKSQIWINQNEIPNNGIDDDSNGYIDDINGWSFLGTKSGNYIVWKNFEYVRVVRKFGEKFVSKNINQIDTKDLSDFKEYQRALKVFEDERAYYKGWYDGTAYGVEMFPIVKDTLKYFFPREDYTLEQLDSLYLIYKIDDKSDRERRLNGDKDLGALISLMKRRFTLNEKTLEATIEKRDQLDSLLNKNLNLNYNERLFIDGNNEKLEKGYGNNKVFAQIKGIRPFHNHSTEVSGIIGAKRGNKIGIDGFSNSIKIMPLNISASGDEYDKDIAMAIYYAVNNGAKVINMSFSKEFSLHKDWVFDALKYAEKNNVLVVHCSGNDNFDMDINPKYPNDNDYVNKTEVCYNFINVGSITNKLDQGFVSDFSNYGSENLDIFAPGSDIYTTFPYTNAYIYDSGTSLAAPMVSGTAALIWLYYPNLSVQEVKKIILESGTSYDIEVLVPGGEGKKMQFKELSKSGKVLNVYNAMKMAKEVSRKKK